MKAPEGKTVFRYNESAGISSLDPAFARDQANIWADNQLFNGLVELDNKLYVKPSLAKSWIISDSGKTYTFNIRNDVFFHNSEVFKDSIGRKMTAYDISYSLLRVLSPKTLSPGAVWLKNILAKDELGDYSISSPNDTTIIIKLKSAFSPFLGRLSMPYFSTVAKEAVDFYGADFSRNPVGTGPFYLKMWKEGVKMVFRKNEKYFEKENGVQLPHLDAVAISFIIDKQSVFLEFIKGNIDFISGIDPSYKDELLLPNGSLNPKYNDKINLLRAPYLNTEYLAFLMENNRDSILMDVRIRKAINYGFDRKKMMRYLRNNIGVAGNNGFVPVGMPGFENGETQGYFFSSDSTLKLLEEAGYPNGKGLPTITLSTTSAYLDICKYIQQETSKLGINMEIDVHQPASLRQMVANARMPFFRGSWIADYADPENYLALFYSPNHSPAGANYTHFTSAAFDKLYVQARSETNDSIRISLYRQMDKMVIDQAPVIVLYYDEALRFTAKNIDGLGVNSMNLLSLKRVVKK
ncbi:MAG: ABC transporter substrate-binding protein [Bacteroidetes bacterium 4572_112]|nr:MAG: ABC transporter substrate-binding protein [Bacteroidetes bacterium 4572_112]